MTQKVVIITGASSGFGRLTALEAVRKGYQVVITARRAERLQELASEIEAAGGTVLAVPGDVTDAADQQQLIERTLTRFGRIDALVNNAGVPLPNGFADSPVEELRRQWETNVLSIVELTRRALPSLIEARGVVINISSGIGRFSIPGMGMYAPTKVAVNSLTDALRRELVPLGVHICLVEPGPYQTEFGQRAGRSQDEPQSGFPAEPVAQAIVRLIERPRRLTVMPPWMRPLLWVASGLVRFLPGPVDLLFWSLARRQQRQVEQTAQAL